MCQMQEKGLAEQLMQVPGDEWSDFLYIVHPTIGVSAVSSYISIAIMSFDIEGSLTKSMLSIFEEYNYAYASSVDIMWICRS